MNLLIVRRPGEAEELANALTSRPKVGCYVLDYPEHSTRDVFRYSLRNLSWTPRPSPNVIVVPFTGVLAPETEWDQVTERLDAISALASRDACTLFLIVPRLESAAQEVFIRKQETTLLSKTPTAFVLHRADLTANPAGLADIVIKLSECGMFGRYSVHPGPKGMTIQPLMMRTPLFRAPVLEPAV